MDLDKIKFWLLSKYGPLTDPKVAPPFSCVSLLIMIELLFC